MNRTGVEPAYSDGSPRMVLAVPSVVYIGVRFSLRRLSTGRLFLLPSTTPVLAYCNDLHEARGPSSVCTTLIAPVCSTTTGLRDFPQDRQNDCFRSDSRPKPTRELVPTHHVGSLSGFPLALLIHRRGLEPLYTPADAMFLLNI